MYTLLIRRRAIKDLASIPSNYAELITQHINDLAQNPYPPDAKKLKDDSGYSQRVGVYRILYDIDNTARIVTVLPPQASPRGLPIIKLQFADILSVIDFLL